MHWNSLKMDIAVNPKKEGDEGEEREVGVKTVEAGEGKVRK